MEVGRFGIEGIIVMESLARETMRQNLCLGLYNL
jgi:hypothetical protein